MTFSPNTDNWTIRNAVADDYDAIVDVWFRSGLSVRPHGRESKAAFLHQLERLGDLYLVAVSEDRLVGVVLGTHDHRKGWINRVAVPPEFRRSGLASALVKACDEAIRAEGIEIVAALVEEGNIASAKLLEKLGYRADVPVKYYRKLTHPDA